MLLTKYYRQLRSQWCNQHRISKTANHSNDSIRSPGECPDHHTCQGNLKQSFIIETSGYTPRIIYGHQRWVGESISRLTCFNLTVFKRKKIVLYLLVNIIIASSTTKTSPPLQFLVLVSHCYWISETRHSFQQPGLSTDAHWQLQLLLSKTKQG